MAALNFFYGGNLTLINSFDKGQISRESFVILATKWQALTELADPHLIRSIVYRKIPKISPSMYTPKIHTIKQSKNDTVTQFFLFTF